MRRKQSVVQELDRMNIPLFCAHVVVKTVISVVLHRLGVLAAMTETARKTSFKNEHLRNSDYFAIIPSCSHFTMLTKNPVTGLV